MSARKQVLVLSFTDHERDPRVFRQVCALVAHEAWDLHTAGLGERSAVESANHVCLKRVSRRWPGQLLRAMWLKAGMFERYYWNMLCVPDALIHLQQGRYDLIVANDLETLPLALKLAGKRGRVWLDAHEYAPRQFEDRWQFRFFFQSFWHYIARRYLPEVDHMTSVGERIGQEYQSQFGVNSHTLINAPAYVDQTPTPVGQTVRLVHHGGTNTGRRLERMVEMMRYVDKRFSLDLYLVANDPQGMRRIQQAAEGLDNVRIREPVPMPALARHLNQYDLGLCFIWPINFNYEYALPNKLFEFVQARLGVAIWPSPEMRKLVEPLGLGPVVESYEAKGMAAVLNALDRQMITSFKQASAHAASQYNAEATMMEIRGVAQKLLSGED